LKAILHHCLSASVLESCRAAAPEWLRIVDVDERDSQRLAGELPDTEVLLHVLEPVTEAMLDRAARLRLIQKLGVGVNTIDLEAAARRGIRVCNMPGVNTQAVAEATLALMLATLRKVLPLDRATREGAGWQLSPDCTNDAREICGKTVGFVGYGGIPRRLAPVLQALGARILHYSRSASSIPLPQLLAESDIVSLHLPLTAETRQLLNRRALDSMKPGAILINTARGGLVDEAALVDALSSGRLRAAGLDVFAHEPLLATSPLCKLSNVVLSPHTAWLTAETLGRCLDIAIGNCIRLRDDLPLLNMVPLPVGAALMYGKPGLLQ
jgi:phosphoglycerate dehydrogenase-like enzyme